MSIQSLSDYLSLTETLGALGVARDNFCRAIEEGKVTLPGYLRSGSKLFLADFLSGLFHESDKDKMNDEVMGYLNCDKTNGGGRLLADLLDTRKDGSEWTRRHDLRSKLYMLKPWNGWFIAFPHGPLWGDWRNTNGIQGAECVIHPEQLGDDGVSIQGVLLDHILPVDPSDPDFPHFALSGTVRLTRDTLIRWARAGRFVSPVRVTPPSWWISESVFVPWTDRGVPKNYFALRYPTTEGCIDTPPDSLSFVPAHGWHDTPTDDDLLFRRDDVEALLNNRLDASPASKPSRAVPVSQQNEKAVLEAIRLLNYDPLKLPAQKRGKPGIKKDVRDHVAVSGLSDHQFNDAWKRLRKDGRIKDAT
ncbi:hypothetical protein [Dyella acidiphila]|uniref:Uncharacterized protein n=1 Tax=Dyella acidiphila TaxID=2775866 RepID=A0ABR9G6H6_9GAMM|nr:hypothetical protein [Dyella acidiphila]MBE1159636.1 hypothetical protein [Dyella acidiphila]